MWNIYDNQYDLSEFMKHHPGGKMIIERSKNEKDLTPLFESYHAFSDIDSIRIRLDRYKVNTNVKQSQFDFTKYHELTSRIKQIYPNRESIKSNVFFVIRLITMFYCFFNLIYISFFDGSYSYVTTCITSFVSGIVLISIGFMMMHDASHYAISIHPSINTFCSYLGNNILLLWNDNIWFYHHVLNHHSFTNVEKEDPDLYNFRPVLHKIKSQNKLFKLPKSFVDIIAILFITCLPGMYLGQIYMYFLSAIRSRLFGIGIPKRQYYSILDKCIFVFIGICFTMMNGSVMDRILRIMLYFIGSNITYAFNIIPDHDTYESSVDNHYTGNDWLKVQIHGSGNFNTSSLIWTYLFGGINY